MIALDILVGYSFGFIYLLIGLLIFNKFFQENTGALFSALLGAIFISWISLLSYILQINEIYTIIPILLLFCIFFIKDNLIKIYSKEISIYFYIHTIVYGIHVVNAYPGIWLAGGDWYSHLSKAIALHELSYSVDNIDRSPFYAAGSIFGMHFIDPYISFYSHSIAVGSAVILAILTNAKNRIGVLLIIISPFFLISLQNLWPKLALGGCLIGTLYFGFVQVNNSKKNFILLMMFFSAGVAYHRSFIFFSPLILLYLTRHNHWNFKFLSLSLLIAFCLFGFYETWNIYSHGISSIINANPVVTYSQDLSFWVKCWNKIDSVFIGSAAWFKFNDRLQTPLLEISKFLQNSYIFAICFVSNISGTIFGLSLIFLHHIRTVTARLLFLIQSNFYKKEFLLLLLSFILLIFVTPGIKHWGLLQASTPALVIAFYWFLGNFNLKLGDFRFAAYTHCFLGITPYLIINLGTNFILNSDNPNLTKLSNLLKKSDSDFITMQLNDFTNFAMNTPTIVPLFTIAVSIMMIFRLGKKLKLYGYQ